jgi:hypothetical protein
MVKQARGGLIMNHTHKKNALQGVQLNSAFDNTKHNSDYNKPALTSILSLTDAIKQDKFTPRQKELLLFLIKNGKSLRKPVEGKCIKVAYAPALLQSLNPKLKTLCNMEIKSILVGDGSQRKVWFLATLKVA